MSSALLLLFKNTATRYLIDSDFTKSQWSFSRAGPGTYVGSDGYVKTAAADVPRFNYNPITGASRGLLYEPVAATNLFTYSEDIKNHWTVVGATWGSTTGVDPAGGTTAQEIIPSSSTVCVFSNTQSLTSGTIYARSLFVRRGVVTATPIYPSIYFTSTGFGVDKGATFNLSTGAVAFSSSGVSASIEPLPNGWYRISASVAATSTAVITAAFRTTSNTSDFIGNAKGDGVASLYVWGAQFEVGSVATSYIPTTTAAVTRAADVLTATLPLAVSSLTYTFDDKTTQSVSVTGGSSYTASGLNLPNITRVRSDAKSEPTGPYIVPASTRSRLPTATLSVGSATTGRTNSIQHLRNNSPYAITSPFIRYINFYADTLMALAKGTATSVTVTASVEYPKGSGTRYQCTKNGSTSMVVANADNYADFDALPFTLNAGEQCTVRVSVLIPASSSFVDGASKCLSALGEGSEFAYSSSVADKTMSGTVTPSNSNAAPTWLLGTCNYNTKAILAVGDSILYGLGETTPAYTSDTDGNQGLADRYGLLKGYNVLNLGRSSSRAQYWATADLTYLLSALSRIHCGIKLSNHFRNDTNAARTPAQIKTDTDTTLARFTGGERGMWVMDCPSVSASSDAWATVDNQTRSAGANTVYETYRQTWIGMCTGLTAITGQTKTLWLSTYTDATTSAGASQPGIVVWNAPNYTNDGTHPLALPYANAAAGNT